MLSACKVKEKRKKSACEYYNVITESSKLILFSPTARLLLGLFFHSSGQLFHSPVIRPLFFLPVSFSPVSFFCLHLSIRTALLPHSLETISPNIPTPYTNIPAKMKDASPKYWWPIPRYEPNKSDALDAAPYEWKNPERAHAFRK